MGTWSKFTQRKAAAILGVTPQTIYQMLQDGRLSSPLCKDEVEALRQAWSIVPYALTADEASRWDPSWRRCMVCLDFFRIKRSWALQGRGWTCSIRCSGKWRSYRTPRITVIKIKAKHRQPAQRVFYAGFCETCGSAFVNRQIKTVCASCLEKQSRRASRDRRKALERGAVKIERVFRRKVYERDKWRCHICGEKISQSLQAPDPGSATLDHIHPLSLGGSHTYDNIKAAHYGCNSARGNRDEFQMRMPVAA